MGEQIVFVCLTDATLPAKVAFPIWIGPDYLADKLVKQLAKSPRMRSLLDVWPKDIDPSQFELYDVYDFEGLTTPYSDKATRESIATILNGPRPPLGAPHADIVHFEAVIAADWITRRGFGKPMRFQEIYAAIGITIAHRTLKSHLRRAGVISADSEATRRTYSKADFLKLLKWQATIKHDHYIADNARQLLENWKVSPD